MVKSSRSAMGDAGLYAYYGLSVFRKLGTSLVEAFQTAFTVDGDIRQAYFRDKGLDHVKAGRYEQGAHALDTVWDEQSGDAEVALHLGIALVKTGELDRGLEVLAKAVELAPQDAKALTVLGLSYVQAQKYDLAVDPLTKAAEANPKNFNVRFRLGVALDNLGHFAKAIESFQAALELRPNEGKVARAIAYCYIWWKNPRPSNRSAAGRSTCWPWPRLFPWWCC